ncbi:MAG: hypothetical protein ACOZBL_02245 [Patescibacteria group bacterium]
MASFAWKLSASFSSASTSFITDTASFSSYTQKSLVYPRSRDSISSLRIFKKML